MKLTNKLLGFLHRVFDQDKDPRRFLALRLRYSGTAMTWRVADGVLTTEVTGGPGGNLSADLSLFTVSELVSYLAAQPGYSVVYADASSLSNLSALVLIDGEADQDSRNGDHLHGYTSELWSYLEANSVELGAAKTQIGEMLNQMELPTASADWVDEHGSYYGVRRRGNETDAYYAPRIIVEVLRPRGNNVAIERAVTEVIGQEVTVTDVTVYDDDLAPLYNNVISYDGTSLHDAIGNPHYGLFDVKYGYDLEGGPDVVDYVDAVTNLVETLRDAGTHMRSFSLSGGQVEDSASGPTADDITVEVGAALADSDSGPGSEALSLNIGSSFVDSAPAVSAEGADMTVHYNHLYDGLRRYDGIIRHRGGLSIEETL